MFGSKGKLKGVKDFSVMCDGTPVQRVFNVKYLGVTLDDQMSGSVHANSVLKKCMTRLAFLYRNSRFLNFHSRKTLCSALIQPHVDYCSSSWYGCLSKNLKSRLDVLQRRMARFVNAYDYRHHIGTKYTVL